MRVIGNIAKKSVPGRVLETWREKQDRMAYDDYADDLYFDEYYNNEYRPRRSRRREEGVGASREACVTSLSPLRERVF